MPAVGARIPLSVHQRAARGARRPSSRSRSSIVRPERDADRQAAERRRAKPDLRRQQPVQRQQVLRLGPHRRRHAAQRRHAVHRAVQPRAASSTSLFGQSYQLFGQNSFAVPDTVNTGLSSGLAKPRSDYVARVAYQPDNIYSVISRFLLDEETFQIRRVELEGTRQFRSLATHGTLRQLRRAARDRLPRAPPGRDRARSPSSSRRTGACSRRRATTSRRSQINQTASDSAISTTASQFRSTTSPTITTVARRRPTTR